MHIVQVKVMYWVDGNEMNALTGITARFGGVLPVTASVTQKQPAVVPSPRTGCDKDTKAIILYHSS
jgi:signal peptide peptidase-like protein 2B